MTQESMQDGQLTYAVEVGSLGQRPTPVDLLLDFWLSHRHRGEMPDWAAYCPRRAAEALVRTRCAPSSGDVRVVRSPAGLAGGTLIAKSPASMIEHAWIRNALTEAAPAGQGAASWSLCTVVDEVSVFAWLSALAQMPNSPLYPWDTVICTSTAVNRVVLSAWRGYVNFARMRFGLKQIVVPTLMVMPGGVADVPEPLPLDAVEAGRATLGAAPDDVVVVVRDEIDDVQALALALAALVQRGVDLSPVVVVLAVGSAEAKGRIEALQSILRRSHGRIAWVPTTDARALGVVLELADVYCSLSHLVEHSGGDALLVAMSRGAAVVASDLGRASDVLLNGYSGLRVPLWAAPAGVAPDLARMNALKGVYEVDMGREVAACTALDMPTLVTGLQDVLTDERVRRALGANAADAARALSWPAFVSKLREAGAHARDLAATAVELRSLGTSQVAPDPLRGDPLIEQGEMVTHTLDRDVRLRLAPGLMARARDQLGSPDDVGLEGEQAARLQSLVHAAAARALNGEAGARVVLPSAGELKLVIATAMSGPQPARQLVAAVPAERQLHVFRALVWLIKVGILEIAPEEERSLERETAEALASLESPLHFDVRPLRRRVKGVQQQG